MPPPPGEIPEALGALERYVHEDTGLLPQVDIAFVHYQFEAIPPFLEGNGRIGRLLIALMFAERDLLPEPLLYLSAHFKRHRDTYCDHLLRVGQERDWEDWLLVFLRGVLEEITGRRRNRVYAAQEIVRVLQGPIGEEG